MTTLQVTYAYVYPIQAPTGYTVGFASVILNEQISLPTPMTPLIMERISRVSSTPSLLNCGSTSQQKYLPSMQKSLSPVQRRLP